MRIDAKAIAIQMAELAADTAPVRVVVGWEPGVHSFYAHVPAELSEDTAVSLCRSWAGLIRESVPDRPDEWSSRITVVRPQGTRIGTYDIGWVGHEDSWVARDDPEMPGTEVWEGLYRRLEVYLGARGKSDYSGENGDYFLYNEESGYADQSINVYRIEFLTPELVRGIQDILKDGYADWTVHVFLDLVPAVAGLPSDGLEIHADHIVEKFDRTLVVRLLAEQLKI